MKSDRARAEGLLLIVVLIWGSNYPLMKFGLAGMDQLVFNALRYVVASIVLIVVFAFRSKWKAIEPGDWKRVIWAGMVSSVFYQILFMFGLSYTSAGNSAVLVSTFPLWTVLINAVVYKEKISRTLWLGLLVSFFGVVLIIIGSGKKLALGKYEIIGDCVSLVAAVFWGYSMNLQQPLLKKYSAHQLALIMIAVGGVVLPLTAISGALATNWSVVQWKYLGAGIYSGIFSVAIGNVLWTNGIGRIGPAKTANFNNLVPVIALAVAYFFLRENLYTIQIVGAAITIVGVYVARRAKAIEGVEEG
ncbi:MAG TPA: DMT family transporter [Bacteroidota bacterium]|nr:DMT family transporter [Bacteroidota bacterium]